MQERHLHTEIIIRKNIFRKIRIETEPDGELRSLPGSFVIIVIILLLFGSNNVNIR